MSSLQNPWDILGKKAFNTHLKEDEIDPHAADNMLIAWPSILKIISQEYPNTKNIKVLDFGCGTGGFCNKLFSLGFTVTGIDPSVEMINIAKRNSPRSIKYILGDQKTIPSPDNTFHIITSIMTLPFIENYQNTFQSLSKVLRSPGLFVLTTFNPKWVKACLAVQIAFADFDSKVNPKKGWKTFNGDIKIPVYIRNAEEYNNIAKQNALINIMEDYPPYNKKFKEYVKKFPYDRPMNISQYLILGYKKT